MPETRVIHFRGWDRSDPNAVYIGRAVPRKGLKASPWANPFRVKAAHPQFYHEMSHVEAVTDFREWAKYTNDPRAAWIRAHVHELRGKTLVCWCAPNACHGDVLAEMADGTKETVSA